MVVVPPGQAPAGQREPAPPADVSVVCGIDGSEQALTAAAIAGRLARRLGYRLVVVHARQNIRAMMSYPGARSTTPPVTGQDDSVEQLADDILQRAAAAAGANATGVIEPGPPAEVLESVAQREHARLIVVAARGLGAMRSALLGSVAAELTATATRPVMVLSESALADAGPGAP